MAAPPSIATSRLILRPFRPNDLAPYAKMNADPDVMRYLGGPISTDETARQMQAANSSWASRTIGKIAIERSADGAFLGMCGLSVEDWYPDDFELGWRLAPAFWGNGYATEAARAWLAHAFGSLDMSRVISIADVPNHRSLAVMARIGMRLDHTARLQADGETFDAEIHAITGTQYRAGNR